MVPNPYLERREAIGVCVPTVVDDHMTHDGIRLRGHLNGKPWIAFFLSMAHPVINNIIDAK